MSGSQFDHIIYAVVSAANGFIPIMDTIQVFWFLMVFNMMFHKNQLYQRLPLWLMPQCRIWCVSTTPIWWRILVWWVYVLHICFLLVSTIKSLAFQIVDEQNHRTIGVIRKKLEFLNVPPVVNVEVQNLQADDRIEKTSFYFDENQWLCMHSCQAWENDII